MIAAPGRQRATLAGSVRNVHTALRDARTVKELLTDKRRTAAVLVTLAEEMPVNEAIELEDKLTGMGIVPQQIVCNQIYPTHFPLGSPVTLAAPPL